MAYMTDGKGPYPNKAGEYCGNYHPDNLNGFEILMKDETPQQAAGRQKEYLARMRFGRPHATVAYTTKQLKIMGYVGLYLKEDRPPFDWETPCETPPELLEPPIS